MTHGINILTILKIDFIKTKKIKQTNNSIEYTKKKTELATISQLTIDDLKWR